LVFPSAPSIAPLIKDVHNPSHNLMNWILTGANLVGNPSINFLLGTHDDMPFNISIDAKIYEDKKLFSHALYLEKMWKEKSEA
jgi:aspartyl-tRNA(Asn)/glutamyl-tRNA(Gln) amidotransferase subunit A